VILTGYDAVDWLLETVGGLDRRQAVNLGVRMWASGFFKHVGSKRPFSDGPNHFYFVMDNKDRFDSALHMEGVRAAHLSCCTIRRYTGRSGCR
jgi:hypothetical protein